MDTYELKLPKFLRVLLFIALFLLGAPRALATDPQQVNFTLEGCRNNGDIALPNGNGDFICPNGSYTTGNLGKGWNELDLVPYRLTSDAGNSAPASQTFTIAVLVDYFDGGHPGYDVLSVPTLNTALSSASCTAATIGAQTVLTPGFGGIDESLYRFVTITQAKNTTCVYDYYARLALGSHLFPGSSLHANLGNENLGTAGIGSKEVSIPVKEILPQELSKTMAAAQDSTYLWTLSKSPSKKTVTFGDVCAAGDTLPTPGVSIQVVWTKEAATPGMVHVTTKVYATNPAARIITVSVTDKIYKGLTQTDPPLDTALSGPVDVPANTANWLVLTHTVALPADAGSAGTLNDVATATYTDKVTGVPVPGTTEATAHTDIGAGTASNTTATIVDAESMTGTGLTFSVAAPGVGSFTNYTAGTQTTGPVNWSSGVQSDSGSVTFDKTLYLDVKRITSGILTDTANLTASDGFTASYGPVDISVDSSASVKLSIKKSIPTWLLEGTEKLEVAFKITGLGGSGYSATKTVLFVAGGPTTQTIDITGLVPDDYQVVEQTPTFYPEGCNDAGCSVPAGSIVPQEGSTQTAYLGAPGGVISACSALLTYTNDFSTRFAATAKVQKITDPVLLDTDPDYNWTFTLTDPGGTQTNVTVGANTGYKSFGVPLLLEGTYTVTETTKAGWDLNNADPPGGGAKTCTFSVDYPEDAGKEFGCSFKNTKRANAKVVKTVLGVPPSGTQSFTFQLRSGASATQAGTILQSLDATAANGGTLTFSLVTPGDYQLCEIVMPGWLTTLGPPLYTVFNPSGDNSTVCTNITLKAGDRLVFAIDNKPPPGGLARTIGFWKNWASCAKSSGKQKPVLDRTLGLGIIYIGNVKLEDTNPLADVASDCLAAVALLSKQDIVTGASKASDPAFNLAAQLLAAKLNIQAGAGACTAAVQAITQAQDLLDGPPPTYAVNFTGTGSYPKTDPFASTANNLATTLDNYNNNKLCQ